MMSRQTLMPAAVFVADRRAGARPDCGAAARRRRQSVSRRRESRRIAAADAAGHAAVLAGRLHRVCDPRARAASIPHPLPARRNAAGATELVNATRGGSEGSDVEVYDPRTGKPLKFTYEQEGNDPENHAIHAHAADSGAGRRRRPRADLQDLQGSAHLHDARRRHRLGAEPERLSARRAAAQGLLVHLVERRGADDDARPKDG